MANPTTITLPVPLPSGHQADVTIPQPLTEEDYKHLTDVLRVMKLGLVATPIFPAPRVVAHNGQYADAES